MRPADAVTVSIFVEVDPLTAFTVFTDEVDLWWRRGPRFRASTRADSRMQFEPGVGGRLVEVLDAESGEQHEIGRVLRWDPGARLVFEFRGRNFTPDQKTVVDVRFEGQRNGTRVEVEHSGWDTLPQDHPVRHDLDPRRFAGMWGSCWADQMRSLRGCAVRIAGARSARPEHPASD